MLNSRRPLRVAVLCSRRAPGLMHLLEVDRHRGRLFDIACVMTSEPDFAESSATVAAGVDVVRHPIAQFCAARSVPVYRNAASRRAYDAATVALLAGCQPDLVLLDGYLYLLTGPMLEAYGNRLLNLHFSDLQVRRPDGRPAYVGLRAVRDALLDGRTDTCATIHLVNDVPDGGAPVVRSSPYPASPMLAKARKWGATEMFKAYVFAHQEWMIRGASGMLLSAALELVATGHVDLDALARADPAAVAPWLVDDRGRLTPPSALRICERLWGYQRASA